MRRINEVRFFNKTVSHHPDSLKCKVCFKLMILEGDMYLKNSSQETICLTCAWEIINATMSRMQADIKKQSSLKREIINYFKKHKEIEARYVVEQLAKEEWKK